MHRIYKLLFILSAVLMVIALHRGRTDGNGGHYDHSTGEYHYHHGEGPHQHYDMDGDGIKDCPLERREKVLEVIGVIAGTIMYLPALLILLALPILYVSNGIVSIIERFIKKQQKNDLNRETSDRIWNIVIVVTTIIITSIALIIVYKVQGII